MRMKIHSYSIFLNQPWTCIKWCVIILLAIRCRPGDKTRRILRFDHFFAQSRLPTLLTTSCLQVQPTLTTASSTVSRALSQTFSGSCAPTERNEPKMLVKEYRIPFPGTLEDYRIGMLYMISRATEEENERTKGKKAVSVVKRERYYDSERGIYGIYTEKVCHIRNFLPGFIKVFVPESKSILIEKAWNGFPDHCLTRYECPFLGDSFHLSIESRYIANDTGHTDNALRLCEKELQSREIVNLNMASDKLLKMTLETDVRKFESKKHMHPILDEGGVWIRSASPIMCCYRVARLDVCTKGLPGSRIEGWGHRHGLQAAFLHYNRQVFCWMDSWFGLSVSDVDGFHEEVREKASLKKKIGKAATTIATEIAGESSAGLAFAFSDETNPFFA